MLSKSSQVYKQSIVDDVLIPIKTWRCTKEKTAQNIHKFDWK